MSIRYLRDMDVSKKRVFYRVDYNVTLKGGEVANDRKIRATIPSLNYLLEHEARIILVTHLGQPEGNTVQSLRTDILAKKLSEILAKEVRKTQAGLDDIKKEVGRMQPKEILMLENIRFYPEEEKNDRAFAEKLAELAEIFVNDAFGVSHRENSSFCAITEFLPSCAGLLIEKEMQTLGKIVKNPKKPFYVIIGGAKLETKIPVIEEMARICDRIFLGGAMIFPFLRSQGYGTGTSLVHESEIPLAKKLLKKHKGKIVLPTDIVMDNLGITMVKSIPSDSAGQDIGPQACRYYAEAMHDAKTVVWNGPLGKFEDKPFDAGTNYIAKVLSKLHATTVIGGGETVTAIENAGLFDSFTLVSTGGGATLEFLEGKKLPAIKALERNAERFREL
ncbi:MAG: phosphoglycerate kinase [Candidatus Woesearchaeota archaeon]